MNYIAAVEAIMKDGQTIIKHTWDCCKTIRRGTGADIEYTNYLVEELIVEDCSNRNCECKIAIWQPTEEDKKADDYIIVE